MNKNRPLSPHLQIYGWQISMFTSVMHRATGIVLAVGSLFVAIWLCAAAAGPDAFAAVNGVVGAWYGQILLFGWTLAMFYHLCNGIRHLAWDFGLGFELDTARTTGYVAIGVAIALTILVWLMALLT
ncbi:MAG TPA: succinate dehydrogenase, cytochrome b556 subunit [Salinisphaeraceae bacterium]|nr:succinate dehydrogenase, cytochrome b556 subunit [Salinisphaeraceae bacterium]